MAETVQQQWRSSAAAPITVRSPYVVDEERHENPSHDSKTSIRTLRSPWNCAASAFFATVGGAGGKLCFSSPPQIVLRISPFLGLFYRACMLFVMLMTNSLSLKYYINALREYTAFQTTTISFALSFLCSGIFGALVFGEPVSVKWVIGAAIMMMGVALLSIQEISKEATE